MADKELDKNQQEEDIDIDALFAKMMADKAASGEEIKQAKEDPEKAAPQPEAEKYAVAENSQETEEEPADDMGTEEAPVETEPAETVESAEVEDTDEKEQTVLQTRWKQSMAQIWQRKQLQKKVGRKNLFRLQTLVRKRDFLLFPAECYFWHLFRCWQSVL